MQIHHLKGYIQSIYLAEHKDKLLLLDGCCRADIPMLKAFITETLGKPFSALKVIVVTHMHPDHAGAADKLRQMVGCKIVSANNDTHWYRGLGGALMHITDIALSVWVAGRLGKPRKNLWYSPKLIPDYRLNDGDIIPGFEEWCVLETPGHTDRDLSVLHLPSRRVYVADLMVKVKNRFIPPFPVFHPNKYRASIERINAMPLSSVMLAHGGEVKLDASDFQHLLRTSPSIPKTPWRATKLKLARMVLGQRASGN